MSEFNFWVLLSPLLALAVNVVAQVIALKTVHGQFFLSVVIGAVVGEIFFLALGVPTLTTSTAVPYILVVQTAYLGASLCYFAFVGLNASSLRIRILEELRAAGGKAPQREILGSYDGQAVRRARMERMSRSGYLVKNGEIYYSGKKLLVYVAYFYDGLRKFLFKL